jgi:hypothetical protein
MVALVRSIVSKMTDTHAFTIEEELLVKVALAEMIATAKVEGDEDTDVSAT